MPLTDLLLTPLSYPFMQHALIGAVAVSSVCAVLSCFVVLKGWSLMGDAIGHGVFLGVVVASFFGLPLALGAFLAGMFCAISVGFLKENTRIKEDTLMGIVFSGMFALGLVAFTKMQTGEHLKHILFGNLLGIARPMLWQTLAISGAVLAVVLLKYKDLLLYAFDPCQARIAGLSVRVLHYGLLVLLSATIVVAMQAVGVILVVAMLISPGITAFLLTKRFSTMLVLAMISSVVSSVAGVFLSFYLDSATGATIVLCQAVLFGLALAFNKVRKLIHKTPQCSI